MHQAKRNQNKILKLNSIRCNNLLFVNFSCFCFFGFMIDKYSINVLIKIEVFQRHQSVNVRRVVADDYDPVGQLYMYHRNWL